jgi:hypothetical protein
MSAAEADSWDDPCTILDANFLEFTFYVLAGIRARDRAGATTPRPSSLRTDRLLLRAGDRSHVRVVVVEALEGAGVICVDRSLKLGKRQKISLST